MSLSHPHWKLYRTSTSLVWEISKQLKVFFYDFPHKNLTSFFSIWWKEMPQQLIIKLFLVDILINVRKNGKFWSCSISYSFAGISDNYLENSLFNFYFGFDTEKYDTCLYSYTSSYLFHIKCPFLTKCPRIRICFILFLQKMVSHIVCCEKLILYLNLNHQHICTECS